jgi:hypothetical protein
MKPASPIAGAYDMTCAFDLSDCCAFKAAVAQMLSLDASGAVSGRWLPLVRSDRQAATAA